MPYIPQSGLSQARDRQGKPQAPVLKPGLFMAKVIHVNRRTNRVDIVLASSEIRRNVPVAFQGMGTRAGRAYMQKVTLAVNTNNSEGGRPLDNYVDDKNRSVFAIVGFLYENPGHPVVLGFITPGTTQMLFDRDGFMLDRHESDLYTMIENGPLATYDPLTDTTIPNFEWFHPSGFFVRVGEGSGHEDLSGQDVQGRARFRGSRNASQPLRAPGPDTADYVPVTVKHPSGTGVVLDTNFNIQTGPGGQAQVNGCRIITTCDDIAALGALEPVCDLLGHCLVNSHGDPVMTRAEI